MYTNLPVKYYKLPRVPVPAPTNIFITGCGYFLKKRRLYQTTSANQNFIICC